MACKQKRLCNGGSLVMILDSPKVSYFSVVAVVKENFHVERFGV